MSNLVRRIRRHGVHARLAALEEEVQEQRALTRRLAELTDLVTELLVPLAERDQETLEDVLERYRAGI